MQCSQAQLRPIVAFVLAVLLAALLALLAMSPKTAFAADTTLRVAQESEEATQVTHRQPVHIEAASVSHVPKRVYTGKRIEPKPKVTFDGKKLKRGRDYTLAYKKNRHVGTARVIIRGKGDFTGSKTVTFQIEARGANLARMACLLSYSQPAKYGGYHHIYKYGYKYTGTQRARNAYRRVGQPIGVDGRMIRHCSVAMGVVARASGYCRTFPCTHAADVYRYLKNKSHGVGKYWKYVGRLGWLEATKKLRPGDIASSNWHLCMYVGDDVPGEVYEEHLKGTDADLGAPKEGENWVSSHWIMSSALCIGDREFAGVEDDFRVYRYVGPSKAFSAKRVKWVSRGVH